MAGGYKKFGSDAPKTALVFRGPRAGGARPQLKPRVGSIICTTIGRARFSNTSLRALESTGRCSAMMLAATAYRIGKLKNSR